MHRKTPTQGYAETERPSHFGQVVLEGQSSAVMVKGREFPDKASMTSEHPGPHESLRDGLSASPWQAEGLAARWNWSGSLCGADWGRWCHEYFIYM